MARLAVAWAELLRFRGYLPLTSFGVGQLASAFSPCNVPVASNAAASCRTPKHPAAWARINGARLLVLALLFAAIPLQAQQPSDEDAARAIVSAALKAFQAADLNGLVALYSPKSPFLENRKRDAGRVFSALADIHITQVSFQKVKLEGDKAFVRIRADVRAILKSTGKPPSGVGLANQIFELVRENGTWRIWRERGAEAEVADAIAAAKTDADRRAILQRDPGMRSPAMVRELNIRGFNLSMRGMFEQARGLHALAKEIAEETGEEIGLSIALTNLAFVAQSLGEFAEARPYHDRALAIAERTGNLTAKAYAWINFGEYRRLRGEYLEAVEAFRKCIDAAGPAGEVVTLANARNDLALVYQSMGDYARAYETFEQARAEAERAHDRPSLARVLNNIGITYYLQGDADAAADYYQRSLDLFTALGYQAEIANLLNNLGLLEAWRHSYPKALDYYRKAVAIKQELGLKEDLPSTLNNIGRCYAEQGSSEEAIRQYEEALSLLSDPGDPTVKEELQEGLCRALWSLRRYKEAAAYGERAVQTAERTGDPGRMSHARAVLGDAYLSLGRRAQVRRCFTEAIALAERARGQVAGAEVETASFFEQHVQPYIAMVRLLGSEGDAAGALAFAERAKARALLDVMSRGPVRASTSLAPAEKEKEGDARARLVSLSAEMRRERARPQPDASKLSRMQSDLEHARRAYESTENGILTAHPELRARSAEVAPFQLSEAAALLPDSRTALVAYTVGIHETRLFVLRRPGAPSTHTGNSRPASSPPLPNPELQSYSIPIERSKLAELVTRFHDQVSDPNRAVQEGARSLYDLLLKPAEAQLRGADMLIVSPDGPLWEVSFCALQSRPGRYLIEDRSVALVPSLTVYREIARARARRRAHPAPAALLAMGNPALGKRTTERARFAIRDAELTPLPEAEDEVREIGRLYGPTAKVYVGGDAREELAKGVASSYRVIHLATHGILSARSPMYSYVVLAQSDDAAREDGLLEAWEMMDLRLNAELVVLSGCDTGQGRIGLGEGLIGMSWALFVAGCPSALVSQWEVRADSTKRLMVSFHLNWRALEPKGGPSKARALRLAALEMLRTDTYRHPFHWAGFALVGDPY